MLTVVRKDRKANEAHDLQHEQIRRQRGFTVTALAEAIGVSHSYVSLVEGGLEKPSPRYRKAAARALKVPEDLLFDETLAARRNA